MAYRTFLAEDFREAENSARAALDVEPDNAVANAVMGNTLAVLAINNAVVLNLTSRPPSSTAGTSAAGDVACDMGSLANR